MCLHIMPVCPLPDGISTPMRIVGFYWQRRTGTLALMAAR